MLIMCPFCGHNLPQPLKNGMSSCNNCQRTFDSSRRNLILSTAWFMRRRNVSGSEYLAEKYGLSPEDAHFVSDAIDVQCYEHDTFLSLLDNYLKKQT